MAEMKTLNGYEVVDAKAREDINGAKEDISRTEDSLRLQGLKNGVACVSCTVANGTAWNPNNAEHVCTEEYVPVKEGDYVTFEIADTAPPAGYHYGLGYFTYDKNKTYIRAVDPTSQRTEIKDLIMTEGVAYFRVSVGLFDSNDVRKTIRKTDFSPYEFKVYINSGASKSINAFNPTYIVDEKLQQLNRAKYGEEKRILTLLHFSDIHGVKSNLQRVVDFYNAHSNRIADMIHTGDGVVFYGDENPFASIGGDMIMNVIGNHECWIEGDTAPIPYNATAKQVYEKFMAPFIDSWGVVSAGVDLCYYYKDYSDTKIRLIVIDCIHFDEAQETWLLNALEDARTKGYSVVGATHYPPQTGVNAIDCTFASIDQTPKAQTPSANYQMERTPEAAYTAVDTFIGNGGEFICWIGGHTHYDHIGTVVNHESQICVIVNTAHVDIYGDEAREADTKTQDCFNIIAFDQTSKLIKIVRIGASFDHYLRNRDTLCLNYKTGEVIGTIDGIDDDLSYLRKGTKTFTDIAQGTYNSGGFIDGTNRLRVNHFIPVVAGEKVKFTAGVKTVGVLVGFFDTSKKYLKETSWSDASTEISIEQDGFVVILFRNATNTEIAVSDYDATIELLSVDCANAMQLQNDIKLKTAQIYDPKAVTPQLGTLNYSAENGYYISTTSNFYFIAVPVESGKEYVLYQKIVDSLSFRIAFTNEPKVYGKTTEYILFRDEVAQRPDNTINPYRFTVPEGYSYLVINIWYATDPKYTLDDMVNSLYIFDAEKIDAEKACAESGANEEDADTTFDGEIAATIREVQEKTVSKAFVFAFMSDSHLRADWAAINRGFDNTVKCLTELNKTLSLDAIVHAGDLVNGYEPFEDIRAWNNYGVSSLLSVGAKDTFIVKGNHDGLYRDENDKDVRFTDGQIYSHFQRYNDINVVRDGISSNYYVDYESHKLRLIVMDNAIGYATATVSWLSGILEGTPESYKVVVFTHCAPRPSLSFSGDSLANYEQIETVMQANPDKIIGHFYGHTHCDNVTYDNGYAEISVACSQPNREVISVPEGATAVPTASADSVEGQCFDIVCVLPNENKFELIRFGGGNNRTVPFAQ